MVTRTLALKEVQRSESLREAVVSVLNRATKDPPQTYGIKNSSPVVKAVIHFFLSFLDFNVHPCWEEPLDPKTKGHLREGRALELTD